MILPHKTILFVKMGVYSEMPAEKNLKDPVMNIDSIYPQMISALNLSWGEVCGRNACSRSKTCCHFFENVLTVAVIDVEYRKIVFHIFYGELINFLSPTFLLSRSNVVKDFASNRHQC